MKILVVSDISWGPGTLHTLQKVVREVRPSLVLVAGDIVDNKHGDFGEFWDGVLSFFTYLSKRGIHVTYVRGNWDRSPWFDRLVHTNLPNVLNCSFRVVEVLGLRILGIPHALTNDLGATRNLPSAFPDPVDILLAHAENIRRVWLLQIPSRAIVTGHFDEQVTCAKGRLFISTWAFPDHYVLLNWTRSRIGIEYRYAQQPSRRATFSPSGLVWKSREFPNSHQYARQLEALIEARDELTHPGGDRSRIEERLLSLGVPKRHVREYLARPAKKQAA